MNVVMDFSSWNKGNNDTLILCCTASFSHSPPNINTSTKTYAPVLYTSCSVCFFCCITTKPSTSHWLTFFPAYLNQQDTWSLSGNLHRWSFLQVPTLNKCSLSHHTPSSLSLSITGIHLHFIFAAQHTETCCITTFQSTKDCIYNGGPIILQYHCVTITYSIQYSNMLHRFVAWEQ